MARPQKPNHPITVRLDQTIYERLNRFCEESGQPKTVAVERALSMYIDDYIAKQELLSKLNNV